MLGGTMPVMQKALAMHDRIGFERTGPCASDAAAGAIYMRREL